MLNQVNDGLARAARVMTLRHPNAVNVTVWRKVHTRDDSDGQINDDDAVKILGGAGLLSTRDEADFDVELLGSGRMMFLGRLSGGEHSLDGINYTTDEVRAYVEPIIDGEFEAKKQDRVYWHLAESVVEYEVKEVISPNNFPEARLNVYVLQPIEMGN